MRRLVREAGLEDEIEVESAGTGDWHLGEPPDARAAAAAGGRGIVLEGAARQVTREDLRAFDLVLAADRDNRAALLALAGGDRRRRERIRMLREFDPQAAARGDLDVPDPYFGGRTASTTCSTSSTRPAAGCSTTRAASCGAREGPRRAGRRGARDGGAEAGAHGGRRPQRGVPRGAGRRRPGLRQDEQGRALGRLRGGSRRPALARRSSRRPAGPRGARGGCGLPRARVDRAGCARGGRPGGGGPWARARRPAPCGSRGPRRGAAGDAAGAGRRAGERAARAARPAAPARRARGDMGRGPRLGPPAAAGPDGVRSRRARRRGGRGRAGRRRRGWTSSPGRPSRPPACTATCGPATSCWTAGGGGALVDPAAHGGHREVDLAMLRLFGGPGPAPARRLRRGVPARGRPCRARGAVAAHAAPGPRRALRREAMALAPRWRRAATRDCQAGRHARTPRLPPRARGRRPGGRPGGGGLRPEDPVAEGPGAGPGAGPGRAAGAAAEPLPFPPQAFEPGSGGRPSGRPEGRTVEVGGRPEGVAVDPESGLAAVGVKGPDQLVLVDVRTGRIARRVPLPSAPRHVQLAAPGGPFLVPAEATDELVEVFPDGRTARHEGRGQPARRDGAREHGVDGRRVQLHGLRGPRRAHGPPRARGRAARRIVALEDGTVAVVSVRAYTVELLDRDLRPARLPERRLRARRTSSRTPAGACTSPTPAGAGSASSTRSRGCASPPAWSCRAPRTGWPSTAGAAACG
jgi:protein-tyrosine phosphatase